MTSNYLVMLVMFAHLAIKERQVASNYFSKRGRHVTTTICCVCLTKQIIQKENIWFMLYHIHGTFKFREFGAAASNARSRIVIIIGSNATMQIWSRIISSIKKKEQRQRSCTFLWYTFYST